MAPSVVGIVTRVLRSEACLCSWAELTALKTQLRTTQGCRTDLQSPQMQQLMAGKNGEVEREGGRQGTAELSQ